jgi:hypothetical protein
MSTGKHDNEQDIRELADRIDFDKQWARPAFDPVSGKFTREIMTQEERDRCEAGVYLRRHASDRQRVVEECKVGRQFLRGYKLTRVDFGTDRKGSGDKEWHGAINAFSNDEKHFPRPTDGGSKDWPRMMYTAKKISDEVPRAIMLFEMERKGQLRGAVKMCGHDPRPATALPDNHLRCHLGVECRKCKYLDAIENAPAGMSPEAKDEAKAWTCATHILQTGGEDLFLEEMIYDKSSAALDQRMIELHAAFDPPEPQMEPRDGD